MDSAQNVGSFGLSNLLGGIDIAVMLASGTAQAHEQMSCQAQLAAISAVMDAGQRLMQRQGNELARAKLRAEARTRAFRGNPTSTELLLSQLTELNNELSDQSEQQVEVNEWIQRSALAFQRYTECVGGG